jgi:hypothetical protein
MVRVNITAAIQLISDALRSVQGALSWRIPLAIQIAPAVMLALGSIFLPASPRLLVAHGRHTEALRSLGKLRRRKPDEIDGDPLLQVTPSTRRK